MSEAVTLCTFRLFSSAIGADRVGSARARQCAERSSCSTATPRRPRERSHRPSPRRVPRAIPASSDSRSLLASVIVVARRLTIRRRPPATPSGRAMLKFAGVSELAVLRPSVGRPRLGPTTIYSHWRVNSERHGDRWTSAHACWAQQRGFEPHNVRKLMRRAEAAGLVMIGKSRGANVYALTGVEPGRSMRRLALNGIAGRGASWGESAESSNVRGSSSGERQ